mgnify:CR=1 FL=1
MINLGIITISRMITRYVQLFQYNIRSRSIYGNKQPQKRGNWAEKLG